MLPETISGNNAGNLIVATGIILAGFVLANILSKVYMRLQRGYAKQKGKNITLGEGGAQAVRNMVVALSLLLALGYLKVSKDIFIIYDIFTVLLTLSLSIILGWLFVGIFEKIFSRFLHTLGIIEFLEESGKEHVIYSIRVISKIILYLVVIVLIINILGIKIAAVNTLLTWVLLLVLALAGLLFFAGVKPLVENYFAGLYLKSSKIFRTGTEMKYHKHIGVIRSISAFTITLEQENGYDLIIPNKSISEVSVLIKKVQLDMKNLEKLQKHYVTQNPSYCGPACLEMVLAIFGYDFDQRHIGMLSGTKVGKGTTPKALIKAAEDLSKGKVTGAWIMVDKITDLKLEIKSWLNDGALVVVDFKKSIIFPDAATAHYALCVGIEGDELIIVDPNKVKGGVYLVDYRKMFLAMDTYSEFLKSKRGYMVFAQSGTPAYERLREGLLYLDTSFYKVLNKKISLKVESIKSKAGKLESIMPPSLKNYFGNAGDKVERVWKPE